jgi:dTDP-glucose pyrophosphorylase/fructosamine-3-kinase
MSSLVNLVIPAAGAATRLRPLSSNTSKVMVRVNGKPCLDYILEQANKMAEIAQVVVVDGKFDDIRNYCEVAHPEVTFVKQPSLDGPRDAISLGLNALDNQDIPVVVWLGDAIILEEDLPFGEDFLLTKEVTDHSAWCMWNGNEFFNKPSTSIPDSAALVGMYSFAYTKGATTAFGSVDGYEISDALEFYSSNYKRVNTNKWYDIGDLPTYYKTCAELLNLKSRYFNNMEFNHELGILTKSPDYHNKESVQTLAAEIEWYGKLNEEQQCFVPRVFKSGSDSQLKMSFESGTLLSDLMLYENLSESAWEYILDKVFTIKTKYFNSRSTDDEFNSKFDEYSNEVWIKKSVSRLEGSEFFDASTSHELMTMARDVMMNTHPIDCMHGDLHFGNILYNQQTDQIKFIDPRGRYGSFSGTQGDNMYDWAKLAHDLYHGYNAMVSNTPKNNMVKDLFISKLKEYNIPIEPVLNGGLILIATCIPLHSDDPARQKRFADYVKGYLND